MPVRSHRHKVFFPKTLGPQMERVLICCEGLLPCYGDSKDSLIVLYLNLCSLDRCSSEARVMSESETEFVTNRPCCR